jgi:hypothetical protein
MVVSWWQVLAWKKYAGAMLGGIRRALAGGRKKVPTDRVF